MQEKTIFSYVNVKGDYLKNINDNTKKIWEKSINDGYDDIIDITKSDDTENQYLVDVSVYNHLLEVSREGEGKDPYGIPNVNFTLIDRDDERWKEYQQQRLEGGFDDSEVWSLEGTITSFILPRLKRFKEITYSYPSDISAKEWNNKLEKMITAFEYLENEDLGLDDTKSGIDRWAAREKVINEGLELFIKYYNSLWY